MKNGFSSRTMTTLGSLLAMGTMAVGTLPDNAPAWIEWALPVVVAGLQFVMGQSHPGTGAKQKAAAR